MQLEELEGRFADVDELTAELATKREEIVEAVGARKQLLAAERQRRASNLVKAAQRILEGVARRAAQLPTADEINAYFAADAMVAKLRDLGGELVTLGDGSRPRSSTSQAQGREAGRAARPARQARTCSRAAAS